ncbi:hypothetical protein Tdes44962_MAKER08679 [Teratosphaeria destructans]|uniref:Uncharacterized protein n=1 Tax=Teratosphaeria destructans TaxID=418781 RepID=A0A9W7SVG2_9PEZI|nr:hypothetical protein Tdes44962_MAKER08679 [Teratosphaeria destructans]
MHLPSVGREQEDTISLGMYADLSLGVQAVARTELGIGMAVSHSQHGHLSPRQATASLDLVFSEDGRP